MRVIVTRPRREAQDWVQMLQGSGVPAQALPLIDIGPAPDRAEVARVWRQLDGYLAVMFVSANAVAGFFEARPGDVTAFAPGVRAWATGPGTTRALLAAGLAPAQVDAPPPDARQFDSEALWQRVAHTVAAGARVLIVRGGDAAQAVSTQGAGRDWLARQVSEAGGTVDFVVSYQRVRPRLDADQMALAQAAAADGSVWLFSSSEAVHNLQACLPVQSWQAARAIATHARIAQAARDAGFGMVMEVRPDLVEIRASLESLQ